MVQDRNSIRPGVLAVITLGFVLTATFVFVFSKPKDTEEASDGEVPELAAAAQEPSDVLPTEDPRSDVPLLNRPDTTALPPDETKQLIQQLATRSANGDAEAVVSLAKLGAEALMPLATLSTNEHENIRAGAINMLSLVVSSADTTFRDQAAEISAEAPNIVPWLAQALTDQNAAVVIASFRALKALGAVSVPALPQMRDAQAHENPEVQREARRAVAHVEHSLVSGKE